MIRRIRDSLPTCMIITLMLTQLSCTAPIDIDTRNSEPVVVVYGYLTDEYKYQNVRVTKSSPYFEANTSIPVPDANVQITSSDGQAYTLKYEKEGYYTSPEKFAAKPGTTYHLTVEVQTDKELEIYEAQTTILPLVPIDSVTITPLLIMGFRHFSLNVYMQEPAETANFYLFRFFLKDSISNEKISKLITTDDRFYNGEYVSGASITMFEDATDEKILEFYKNRYDEDDDAYNYLLTPGDTVRVQVLNIEKGYCYFIQECISEMYGENPFFGGPPSNITTNLSNGAVGFFTGFCIQEHTAVTP